MSLRLRLLGRDRPAPDEVVAVARTVSAVPGVSAHDIPFTWLQYGSGALSGGDRRGPGPPLPVAQPSGNRG